MSLLRFLPIFLLSTYLYPLSSVADEYRLFVDDAATCASLGLSGAVCVAPATSVAVTPPEPPEGPTEPPVAPPVPPTVSGDYDWLDFGPGGRYANGTTYKLVVDPGKVISMPFTVIPGRFTGSISRAPTSVTLSQFDGAYPRFWMSSSPGGEPLDPVMCSQVGGSEASFDWYQEGSGGFGCRIPNSSTLLYVNWARCGLPASDLNCSLPGTGMAGASVETYVRAVVRR